MSNPERVIKAEEALTKYLATNIACGLSDIDAPNITKLIRNLIDERVLHLMKSEGFLKKFMEDK